MRKLDCHDDREAIVSAELDRSIYPLWFARTFDGAKGELLGHSNESSPRSELIP